MKHERKNRKANPILEGMSELEHALDSQALCVEMIKTLYSVVDSAKKRSGPAPTCALRLKRMTTEAVANYVGYYRVQILEWDAEIQQILFEADQ